MAPSKKQTLIACCPQTEHTVVAPSSEAVGRSVPSVGRGRASVMHYVMMITMMMSMKM